MLKRIKLIHFDKYFGNKYREHSFLTHPLVPDSIRNSNTHVFFINNTLSLGQDVQGVVTTLTPADETLGPTQEEILKWFSGRMESVLHLHSMYYAFSNFTLASEADEFAIKCKRGFIQAKQYQFK